MIDALMNRLLNLKVARDRKGMAPNKPLLVLAILDLVDAGLVGMDGLVHKDSQLNLRFRSYSPICAPRRGNAIDLNLPFRHLASDGVYVHVGEGERTVKLDSVLLAAMQEPAWRQGARKEVVALNFSVGAGTVARASKYVSCPSRRKI
jgi:putative restriction endonuclease